MSLPITSNEKVDSFDLDNITYRNCVTSPSQIYSQSSLQPFENFTNLIPIMKENNENIETSSYYPFRSESNLLINQAQSIAEIFEQRPVVIIDVDPTTLFTHIPSIITALYKIKCPKIVYLPISSNKSDLILAKSSIKEQFKDLEIMNGFNGDLNDFIINCPLDDINYFDMARLFIYNGQSISNLNFKLSINILRFFRPICRVFDTFNDIILLGHDFLKNDPQIHLNAYNNSTSINDFFRIGLNKIFTSLAYFLSSDKNCFEYKANWNEKKNLFSIVHTLSCICDLKDISIIKHQGINLDDPITVGKSYKYTTEQMCDIINRADFYPLKILKDDSYEIIVACIK